MLSVKDGGQIIKIAVLRNLLKTNKNSYWRCKNICIISRHRSLWQSSNEFLATRRSLDHRDTKYRFCYSKKHTKYGGRMRTSRKLTRWHSGFARMRNTVRGSSLWKNRHLSKIIAHLLSFPVDQLMKIERNRKEAMDKWMTLKPLQDHMNIVEINDVAA